MRWLKRLVVGTLSVVLVLVALALIVPFLIPTSAYKDQIETRVKAATGRDLKLGGELKLSILPSLELSASDVAFGNRPGAAQKDMAKLKGLSLKLKLAPLLSGRFEIVALELVEPSIVLDVDKDGKPNWQFEKPAGAAPPPAAPAKPGETAQAPARLPTDIFDTLQIETLRIVRGNVVYSDARSGAKYEVAKANIDISLPGGTRPFRLAGDVDYKGKQVAFKTEVKAPVEMMKGQPSDLAIELSLGDLGKITLQGRAQADPANPKAARVSGPLKIDVPSVRALAAWAGAPLAPGKAFGPMNVSATVGFAADRVSLSALSFKLDEIAATGELAMAMGPVPTVTGSLVIPALNLTPFMAGGAPAAAPAPARPGAAPPARPASPGAAPGAIDPAPLRAVNADLKIEARQIQANQFRAELARIGIKLAGGVLAVNLDPVQLYGGAVTGVVTVNGSRAPLSVNPNVQIKGINGHALLSALGATDRIDGTLNASANLTGTGADAKSIQNSLAGTAAFQFANGALRGYNLAGMFRAIGDIKNPLEVIQQVKKAVESLNKFDASQKTDFSELSASFRAANGVFSTSDLRMSAPLIRVEGRGNISLPASALDMNLLVRAVASIQGQGADFAKLGIPIPLRVHGPFGNVSWGLDEKALGDEIRKKAPDLIKEQILQKPGDFIKKPGGILEQFRR